MFGLNSLFQVLMGDESGAIDEGKMMQMQMGGGMMGGGPRGSMPFDAKKAFKAERQALASVAHSWEGDNMEYEKKVLGPGFALSQSSKNLGF